MGSAADDVISTPAKVEAPVRNQVGDSLTGGTASPAHPFMGAVLDTYSRQGDYPTPFAPITGAADMGSILPASYDSTANALMFPATDVAAKKGKAPDRPWDAPPT